MTQAAPGSNLERFRNALRYRQDPSRRLPLVFTVEDETGEAASLAVNLRPTDYDSYDKANKAQSGDGDNAIAALAAYIAKHTDGVHDVTADGKLGERLGFWDEQLAGLLGVTWVSATQLCLAVAGPANLEILAGRLAKWSGHLGGEVKSLEGESNATPR